MSDKNTPPQPIDPPTPRDITAGRDEVTPDELSKQEERNAEVENRAQRLGSDAVQQRNELQKMIFGLVILVIFVFYTAFIFVVAELLITGKALQTPLPVTGVVLIGMLGSIPTLLALILMNGLFSTKDASKDKEDRSSMPDVSLTAKVITEVLKLTSKPH